MSALKPQTLPATSKSTIEIDHLKVFFSNYAALPALSKEATKKGEAVELFHTSRGMLESLLRSTATGAPNRNTNLPVYHALLSLLYWLYPNYLGYNRMKNALAMFRHAKAATSSSANSSSEAFVTGLFIQLRILPFLVRSKKADPRTLSTARELALVLIESNSQKKSNLELIGIVLDGLGFSYYQLERDKKNAISYLTRSLECLYVGEKQIAEEMKQGTPARSLKAKFSFYQALAAVTYCDLAICYESEAEIKEGQEMFSFLRLARSHYQKAYDYAKRTPWHFYKGLSAYDLSGTYAKEGEIEIEKEKAIELLKKAVAAGEESLEWFSLWSTFESDFVGGLGITTFLQKLAKNSDSLERRRLMDRSMKLALKAESVVNKKRSLRYTLVNLGDVYYHTAEYYRELAVSSRESSKISGNASAVLLDRSLVYCLKSKSFYREERYSNRSVEASLLASDICYELLTIRIGNGSIYSANKRRYANTVRRLCNSAIRTSQKFGWNERVAESNWHLAQVFGKEGNFGEAANYYEKAYESYLQAMSSAPKARLYQDLAYYMLAWNRIEKAKVAHRKSDFTTASDLYREASTLVSRSRRWQTSSELYMAESLVEKAEDESLANNAQASIDLFDKAALSLSRFMAEIKSEQIEEKFSYEELANELLTFCNARVILEKSKDAYRIGDIQKSITGLTQAGDMFSNLSRESLALDSSRANELDSLASLCAALTSFQKAQLSGDSKLFLEARQIFGEAALQSRSRVLKPLLQGLASFSEFLYSSKKIQESLGSNLDIELIVECNKALDSAEVMFRKLGNKSFLGMLRASKHILDATINMGAAEREIENAGEKTRLYSRAQKSLSLAARYYKSLGSSKRVQESIQLMSEVKSHQRLIPLAHDIIAEVAANQIIFTAISSSTVFEQSPQSSSAVLSSAYVVLDIEIPKPYIQFNEEFSYAITLINLGKETAITAKIDDAVPEGFEVVDCAYVISEDRSLSLNTRIEPSSSKQIMITAKPVASGERIWHPSLVYLDSSRKYRITKAETARLVVESESKADYHQLIARKSSLEAELADCAKGEDASEKIFTLKEQISKIEEELLRAKNEFVSMNQNLENTRVDLAALNSSESFNPEVLAELKTGEKILIERIEKRRKLLEEAHML
ncbi:MAG: hypothetical protein ACYC7D_11480 [Nitrososphaerales archaeon]